MKLKLKLDRGLSRWLRAYQHSIGNLHGSIEETAVFLIRDQIIKMAGREGGYIGEGMRKWIDAKYPAGAGVKKSKQPRPKRSIAKASPNRKNETGDV